MLLCLPLSLVGFVFTSILLSLALNFTLCSLLLLLLCMRMTRTSQFPSFIPYMTSIKECFIPFYLYCSISVSNCTCTIYTTYYDCSTETEWEPKFNCYCHGATVHISCLDLQTNQPLLNKYFVYKIIRYVNGGARNDLHMLRTSCDVLPTKQQCSRGADLLTLSEYSINIQQALDRGPSTSDRPPLV